MLSGIVCHAGDIDMFCLKGNVDSICISMNDAGLEWQTEFKFDNDGFLIGIDGDEFDCERDSSGRIVLVILEDYAEDDENELTTIETRLEYDDAGRVVKATAKTADEQWSQDYHYDNRGLLTSLSYDTAGENEVRTYTYVAFDSHGNWTERIENLSSMEQTIKQTRHIVYK